MAIDNIDDVKNFFTNPENVASLNIFNYTGERAFMN